MAGLSQKLKPENTTVSTKYRFKNNSRQMTTCK